MITNKVVLTIIILFINTIITQADSSIFKHNLNFGMKRKEAKKIIENAGYEILGETKVSKQIRTFLVGGILYNNIFEASDPEVTTKLEFYKNKLMNSKLLIKSRDSIAHNDLTNIYSAQLVEKYGKPTEFDKVMSIKSWMWITGNIKILLNSDNRRKTTKISYIYLPLYLEMYEGEVKVRLEGEPFDPVNDMFLK